MNINNQKFHSIKIIRLALFVCRHVSSLFDVGVILHSLSPSKGGKKDWENLRNPTEERNPSQSDLGQTKQNEGNKQLLESPVSKAIMAPQ